MERIKKIRVDFMTKKFITIKFEIDDDNKEDIENILDKIMISLVEDSANNDGKVRILKKPLFDSKLPIERLDVDDSKILELAYNKNST